MNATDPLPGSEVKAQEHLRSEKQSSQTLRSRKETGRVSECMPSDASQSAVLSGVGTKYVSEGIL